MSAVLVPSTRDQKLPLKTSDSLVLSSKERTKEKPNPAHTWVAFDYTLPFNSIEGAILVFDVTGHVIKDIRLTQNKGQQVMDTRNIPAGVYIYKVESSGFSKSGKLIIR